MDVKPEDVPHFVWDGWMEVRNSGRYIDFGDYLDSKHPMMEVWNPMEFSHQERKDAIQRENTIMAEDQKPVDLHIDPDALHPNADEVYIMKNAENIKARIDNLMTQVRNFLKRIG